MAISNTVWVRVIPQHKVHLGYVNLGLEAHSCSCSKQRNYSERVNIFPCKDSVDKGYVTALNSSFVSADHESEWLTIILLQTTNTILLVVWRTWQRARGIELAPKLLASQPNRACGGCDAKEVPPTSHRTPSHVPRPCPERSALFQGPIRN